MSKKHTVELDVKSNVRKHLNVKIIRLKRDGTLEDRYPCPAEQSMSAERVRIEIEEY